MTRCAEIKLRAERRCGEELAKVITKGGETKSHDATLDAVCATRMQSHHWQSPAPTDAMFDKGDLDGSRRATDGS